MISKERPSTAGLTSTTGNRQFETFSKQHREKLAMGATHGAVKTKRSKARITVVVRKRPLSQAEAARNESDILKAAPASKTTMKVEEPRKNVCGVPYIEMHDFTFDRAYSNEHSNKDVYRSCVRQLVDHVFTQGARCSCFTYGQTGSGKTYTMCGPERMGSQVSYTSPENQGLLELAARDCFKWLQQPEFDYHFGLYVSFFEIYCNKVYDLLGERRLVKALETKTADGVVVKDLTTIKTDGVESLLRVINSGLDLRVVGSNSKNNDSSRGHAVLTLEVRNEHTKTNFGKLAFIDLAGSERGADAMFSGKQTQTDGAGINRSLLALKECIRALDQQSSHVPFRDSELTKVLRDMFIGSKARTLMISCVSPSSGCCEQTLNTLRYAERVKAIRRNCQPDVDTTDTESDDDVAVNTGRELKGKDGGKGDGDENQGAGKSRRRRPRDSQSESQTREDGKSRRSRKRQEDVGDPNGGQRHEPPRRQVQRSLSRSVDGSVSVTDTDRSSGDESDRKSSMLSLGTSHDSDDFEERRRMMTSDSEDEGDRRTPPLSARLDGDPLSKTVGARHRSKTAHDHVDGAVSTGEIDDLPSPRGGLNKIATLLPQSRGTQPPVNTLSSSRAAATRSPLSRGIDPRLTASCFDPATGEQSPTPLSSMAITDANNAFLRNSLGRQRPLSGTLTAESRNITHPLGTTLVERPSSQQLTLSNHSRRMTTGGGNLLPQRQLRDNGTKGRTSSLVRDQSLISSTRVLTDVISRQGPLGDGLPGIPHQRPDGQDTTRTTMPSSFSAHRENGRSEIAKFFPKPESDDLVAAANLLRKRYREFEFPIPPTSAPTDGKHVEVATAMDMLDQLLVLPANDIHSFYEQYTGKMQQFYSDLVQAHMDCLKAHTCSGMTQQKMLKEVYSSQQQHYSHQFDIDRQYLSNLRSTLENQLLIQFRLAKRLGEMERMVALQRTIVKGFQAASASEVEYYPFNAQGGFSHESSNTASPSSVLHSLSQPASARLLNKTVAGMQSSPSNLLSRSLSGGILHESNIPTSSRTPSAAGGITSASTTASSAGTASLRTIQEYSPMVVPSYRERREVTPRTASIEGGGRSVMVESPKLKSATSNHDSRPLQPPTALSLEGSVRMPTSTTTVIRRRDIADPSIGPDGFPIPNDLGHRVSATTTSTSSARRTRRSRKTSITELGDEPSGATGDLVAAVKEGLAQSGATRPSRRAARRA